jgi:hypothetical protein
MGQFSINGVEYSSTVTVLFVSLRYRCEWEDNIEVDIKNRVWDGGLY